jgi:tRNA A-37 threonylcarbamoyl transferase component Bud32/membrane-associated phospholipid phosphatase
VFVVSALLLVGLWVALAVDPVGAVITRADVALLRWFARFRVEAVVEVLDRGEVPGAPWSVRVAAWATLIALVAFRRFQHLIVYLLAVLALTALNRIVAELLGRMRPTGIEIVGHWSGYSHPSMPVFTLGFVVVGALYGLVPPGSWRRTAAWVAAVPIAVLVLTRLYLGVDHPSDAAAGLVTGVAVPVVAFRLLAPEDAFPIVYRRQRRAHLDISGRRAEAIAAAVEAQLGMQLLQASPFGLAGSAGSTPLRLEVRAPDGTARTLFAKLYAIGHLRSDRWYKLARAVLYGRLEDEKPFNTVRRLVGYEDYMIRLLRDAGVPTAQPLGIVEITPEREYLMVTEFLEGAAELDGHPVTDEVMDSALTSIRRLWVAGLAHRDIKPSNLLVRDDRVFLIDVAFGEARPTPWRQAVDLANMMLTLALGSSATEVYGRALLHFEEGEIAEAFAASRGVTIPSQLRAHLDADGRGLLHQFSALAPPRQAVAIQRWSLRRAGLTLGLAAGAMLAASLVVLNLRLADLL